MKADVSRADLLKYLFKSEQNNLELIADCFHYQHKPVLKQDDKLRVINIAITEPVPFVSTTLTTPATTARPPERFCHLSHISTSDLVSAIAEEDEIPLPEWMQGITPLNLDEPFYNMDCSPPPLQPLVSWSRLWPVLRILLSAQQRKNRPDLNRLVKILANARQPTKIPWQQQKNWTAGLRILMDYPNRMRLFDRDYLQLVMQLKKLRGDNGFISEILEDYPGGRVISLLGRQNHWQAWKMPEPGTPLLILSDLGLYDSGGQAEKHWLAFGRKLLAAGCTAYVLMPVPARYLSREMASYYQCISWDRLSDLKLIKMTASDEAISQKKQQDKNEIDNLLPWLSPMLEIEPALLRAIRHNVYNKDVSFEGLVWNHEDITRTTTYIRFTAEKLQTNREKFMGLSKQDPFKAQQLYDLVKCYHVQHYLPEFYEEINILAHAGNLHDGNNDEILAQAQNYIKKLVCAVYSSNDVSDEQSQRLAYYNRYLLNRQPHEQITRQQDYWSSLWGMLRARRVVEEKRPGWLKDDQANPFLNQKQNKTHYCLLQQGETLMIASETRLAGLKDADLETGQMILLEFDSSGSLLLEEKCLESATEKYDHKLHEGVLIPLSLIEEKRKLHVNGVCYTLEAVTKPAWATAIGRDQKGLFVTVTWLNEPRLYWQNPELNQAGQWVNHEFPGEDKYGFYVDIIIKGITQRFRWIEPGCFLMGSPESELERYDGENQHEVTLTQGYWLADTACTQGLWQAVMGNNPASFKDSLNNPVEQVSFEDVQRFIDTLNGLFPCLNARLPTEAQWEYACRAGTTTPFSFGNNITPDQVNYNGGYPYAGGKKGRFREKTVAVKSLPANPWGLYEMHGNVWEWCLDYWQGHLPKEPALDPKGPKTGSYRVLRGGCWSFNGRRTRSAQRNGSAPVHRFQNFGFRFAPGLELKPGQAGASGTATDSRVAEQRQSVAVPEAEQSGLLTKIKNN